MTPDDDDGLYALNDHLSEWVAENVVDVEMLDDDELDRRLNEATHAAACILRGEQVTP